MSATVSVVGGGLSGLTAAFDLARAGADVTVFEAGSRWGGKIFSSPVGQQLVDAGPDAFLARVPHGRQLVEDIGLVDQLVSPVAQVPAYVHHPGERHEGRLVALPQGTMLGVPTDLAALDSSGLISHEGVVRAQQDLVLPATPFGPETTVGSFCRARLGDEVTERLIDPLIGGINASDIDTLSLELGAPQLAAAARTSPSLIEGLRAARAHLGATLGSAKAEPVFFGLKGGMAQLVDALLAELTAMGVNLRLGTPVRDLTTLDGAVVLATEAHAAHRLLQTVSTEAATALSGIRHASVSQVTARFRAGSVDPILDASGILFPRVDGLVITAATWFSTKWERYQQPGEILIRMTSGRFNDSRSLDMDDATLTRQLLTDLGSVISFGEQPLDTRVVRWNDAFPQYEPGHAERVAAARDALERDAPNIRLVGNSYGGIGIPASIKLARETAAELLG